MIHSVIRELVIKIQKVSIAKKLSVVGYEDVEVPRKYFIKTKKANPIILGQN